jgi:tetratricopeptide (TPR) repeat protein
MSRFEAVVFEHERLRNKGETEAALLLLQESREGLEDEEILALDLLESQIHLELGNLEFARQALNKATERSRHPSDQLACHLQAAALFEGLGKQAERLAELERAHELNRKFAEMISPESIVIAKVQYGIALAQNEEWKRAAEILEPLKNKGYSELEIHFYLGHINLAWNRWREAIREYRVCLSRMPEEPFCSYALYGTAFSHMAMHDYSLALPILRQLRGNTHLPSAHQHSVDRMIGDAVQKLSI